MLCHASNRHRPYQTIGENEVTDAHMPASCPDGTDEGDDKRPSHPLCGRILDVDTNEKLARPPEA